MNGGFWLRAAVSLCLLGATSGAALGAERYALVVTGATGGDPYAQQYDAWRTAFANTLTHQFEYPADHVAVLAENEAPGVGRATREGVRSALTAFGPRLTKDDVLLVLLIGHGTGVDGDEAKFNLVGPDLSAREWADLLKPLPGRLVFVNTASGSFPFLEKIAARGRVVVTANDSAAQQFETVFPGFFVKAFEDVDADLDKNGKVSIWEAFVAASDGVRRWYEEQGRLMTERALLDDSGDGIGREADGPAPASPISQFTYLQPERAIPATGDSELEGLLRRRAEIESEVEQLKARKGSMLPDDYDAALEKVLLELARIDRRVRSKS